LQKILCDSLASRRLASLGPDGERPPSETLATIGPVKNQSTGTSETQRLLKGYMNRHVLRIGTTITNKLNNFRIVLLALLSNSVRDATDLVIGKTKVTLYIGHYS
jgi:hypothetical protein